MTEQTPEQDQLQEIQIHQCWACGAAVINPQLHNQFHADLAAELQKDILLPRGAKVEFTKDGDPDS